MLEHFCMVYAYVCTDTLSDAHRSEENVGCTSFITHLLFPWVRVSLSSLVSAPHRTKAVKDGIGSIFNCLSMIIDLETKAYIESR